MQCSFIGCIPIRWGMNDMSHIFEYKNILFLCGLTLVSFLLSVKYFYDINSNESESQLLSPGQLLHAIEDIPQGNSNIILLFFAGFWLYSKLFGLSRNDLSLKSFLLHFGSSIFAVLLIYLAVSAGQWLNRKIRIKS